MDCLWLNLSVQVLPVAVGHLLGPCIFSTKGISRFVRPAPLASFFGYSLGGLSITIDMGRYWHLPISTFRTVQYQFRAVWNGILYDGVYHRGDPRVCACMAWFPRFEEMVLISSIKSCFSLLPWVPYYQWCTNLPWVPLMIVAGHQSPSGMAKLWSATNSLLGWQLSLWDSIVILRVL